MDTVHSAHSGHDGLGAHIGQGKENTWQCEDMNKRGQCTADNGQWAHWTVIYIKIKTVYKNKKKQYISAPVKQCVTSFARCTLYCYVQSYLTKQCAHPDIYITVWGSIDTHRYIYIIYNNNIYFYALL